MKRAFLSLATFAVLAAACGSQEQAQTDPRIGDRGLLRFNGGGCTGSTAMAVGSHETLTIEQVDGSALPEDLTARTSAPEVIAARMHGENQLTLEAHAAGESHVDVLARGNSYDGLTFRAEPAAQATALSPPRVLAGGVLDVVVTDVFGDCKTSECPLFGQGFLGWRTEPVSAMTFVGDEGGAAMFRAGDPGNVRVLGREPVRHVDLVSNWVSIEPTEGSTGLVGELTTIPLEEGETPVVVELPGSIPAGTAFCVRIDVVREEGPNVAVSRKDVLWSVTGGIEVVPIDHGTEPLGTVFVANAAGTASLTARVGLVDLERAFELTVTP